MGTSVTLDMDKMKGKEPAVTEDLFSFDSEKAALYLPILRMFSHQPCSVTCVRLIIEGRDWWRLNDLPKFHG